MGRHGQAWAGMARRRRSASTLKVHEHGHHLSAPPCPEVPALPNTTSVVNRRVKAWGREAVRGDSRLGPRQRQAESEQGKCYQQERCDRLEAWPTARVEDDVVDSHEHVADSQATVLLGCSAPQHASYRAETRVRHDEANANAVACWRVRIKSRWLLDSHHYCRITLQANREGIGPARLFRPSPPHAGSSSSLRLAASYLHLPRCWLWVQRARLVQ